MPIKLWQSRTTKYFYAIAAAVLLVMLLFILIDSFKSRQIKESLTFYMDNLRDMVFMSTYDSLKKGNMKLFKSHLEEIGTFDDVQEFSLLNTKGIVNYSSDPELVKQLDSSVLGLEHQEELIHGDFTTYYFPVETIFYCSRCHIDWKVGSINSYYRLTLSRKALDALENNILYYRGFIVAGGCLFLAFTYLLFLLYERKKHEEQMLLSVNVFANAVEAIAITSFEGKIERINPAFSKITGFEADEILGQNIHLLDAGEVNQESYQKMREQLTEQGLWSGELWNRRKNGEIFPTRLSVTAVRNVQNRITNFISIFYDIGAEKAAERALVEMNQMKSEFISTAAHELRSPLIAIMGFTAFVREPEKYGGFSAEQIQDFLEEIYDGGNALEQIVDDLLDVSRIESGNPLEFNLQKECLADILGKAIEFHRIHNTKHTFKLDFPEKLDKAVCLIDRYRINQVLANLLNNATKYSAKGSEVLLKGELTATAWEISVQDEGIGMSSEEVARVFDKFYRANAADRTVTGLGLGMSVAKSIVEGHGGRIWVKSVKGEGTTVTFTLPQISA